MSLLENINKLLDHRVRLGIMSILMVNENVNFKRLKELLEVTDGNLASHIKALEKANYLSVQKSFIDRKPNTQYAATRLGKKEFQKHIDALEEIINRKN